MNTSGVHGYCGQEYGEERDVAGIGQSDKQLQKRGDICLTLRRVHTRMHMHAHTHTLECISGCHWIHLRSKYSLLRVCILTMPE